MALTLLATIENTSLKLAWTDGKNRPPAYCVHLGRVVTESERLRQVLSDFTQYNIRTDSMDYSAYFGRLQDAAIDLGDALFDAVDNDSAVDDAETLVRQASKGAELSIFSEVCIPWTFVMDRAAQRKAASTSAIADFEFFWGSRFALTLRPHQTRTMEPEPRKRENFKMLHALHKERFNAALKLLGASDKRAFDDLSGFIEQDAGHVTNWQDCREKWSEIRAHDSFLHIFGHSDGQRIYLKDPGPGAAHANAPVDDPYCLEADRFRSLFAKDRKTDSVTICFLNGCKTGAGPVGDSFLDVLFGKGFQGFVGTEAEVSNRFAAAYASEFMRRLWSEGATVRQAFDALRVQLFPLSLVYSCYAHPDFRIENTVSGNDVADSRE